MLETVTDLFNNKPIGLNRNATFNVNILFSAIQNEEQF